jgi:hypothetical protein
MCSIFASPDVTRMPMLYDVNSYRGTFSYSIAFFGEVKASETDSKKPDCLRFEGMIQDFTKQCVNPWADVQGDDGFFYVGHSQAPTGAHSEIHPALVGNKMLWHNGIVKQHATSGWDTKDILERINKDGWSALSDIDGTFACVLYDADNKAMYCFRNEISPLFWNGLELSSTKLDGFDEVPANKVWWLNWYDQQWQEVAEFTTKENPYWGL